MLFSTLIDFLWRKETDDKPNAPGSRDTGDGKSINESESSYSINESESSNKAEPYKAYDAKQSHYTPSPETKRDAMEEWDYMILDVCDRGI